MLDKTVDMWPLGATLHWSRQYKLEDWEIDNVVCTIERPHPYGNRPGTLLKVVRDQGHFLVIHTTQDGSLIEYQERPFRKSEQATNYALAQSLKASRTGRLWTYEIDGESYTNHVEWDGHIQFEVIGLMELAGMDCSHPSFDGAMPPRAN